jgi:hypothetical protein
MDYTETENLIADEKAAAGVLRDLTEAAGKQPGTPNGEAIEEARDDCEAARLAVLADLRRQLLSK